jgi:hypothetical protein
MTRDELEHLLRACANVLNDRAHLRRKHKLVVVGSQSILGQYPAAPVTILQSMEADIFPLDEPQSADVIDGALGEGSHFHETHGFYAQGVGPTTAILPEGWEERLVKVETPATDPGIGLCLEVHDLAISKYLAGRPKDLEFTAALARHDLTRKDVLLERLATTTVDMARRKLATQRIALHFRRRR